MMVMVIAIILKKSLYMKKMTYFIQRKVRIIIKKDSAYVMWKLENSNLCMYTIACLVVWVTIRYYCHWTYS